MGIESEPLETGGLEIAGVTPKGRQQEIPRPTKTLPTDRIHVNKQFDLLRAYAAVSGPEGKVVTNAEVAKLIELTTGTVSLANAFFADTGFITRVDNGYLPSQEVRDYQVAYQWEKGTAGKKLSPLLNTSWFGKALLTKLNFSSLNEDEAIAVLADACSALPSYKSKLRALLDYLELGGAIVRENNQIRSTIQAISPQTKPEPEPLQHEPRPSRPTSVQGFTEGGLGFSVNVRVDMKELAGWQADRIAAFFNGIAQVISAKSGLKEQD